MKQKDNYPKNYRVRIKDSENDYFVLVDNQARFTFSAAENIVYNEIHRTRFEDKVKRIISIECTDCGRHLRDVYVTPKGFSTIDMADPDNHIIYVGEGFETSDLLTAYGLSHFYGNSVKVTYGDENDATVSFDKNETTVEFTDGFKCKLDMKVYLEWEGSVPSLDYEALAFDLCNIIDKHLDGEL